MFNAECSSWEKWGSFHIQMFCESDVEGIKDSRHGRIPQAIGFGMGSISNQDTGSRSGI